MDELARRVGERLKAANAMLATAESCTGGWAAQVVTSVAGSSCSCSKDRVSGTSTSPVTWSVQAARSTSGTSPAWSTGHLSV